MQLITALTANQVESDWLNDFHRRARGLSSAADVALATFERNPTAGTAAAYIEAARAARDADFFDRLYMNGQREVNQRAAQRLRAVLPQGIKAVQEHLTKQIEKDPANRTLVDNHTRCGLFSGQVNGAALPQLQEVARFVMNYFRGAEL